MKFDLFIVIFGIFTLSNAVTLLDGWMHGWMAFKVRAKYCWKCEKENQINEYVFQISNDFFFQFKHAKRYKNFFEDARRRNIYVENSKKVREHNQRFDRGEVTYRLALNKYSDLTNEEFISLLTGLKTSSR